MTVKLNIGGRPLYLSAAEFRPKVTYILKKIKLVQPTCEELSREDSARPIGQLDEELDFIQAILDDIKTSIHSEGQEESAMTRPGESIEKIGE